MKLLQHRSKLTALAGAICVGALAASTSAQAQMTEILPSGYYVTGVRQDTGGNILLTGGPGATLGSTAAFLYDGPQNAIPSNPSDPSLYYFHPFNNSSIGAEFYGPNTSVYNPAMGAGNITAVGAYQIPGNNYQSGMLYVGPLNGTGTWTNLVAPGNGTGTVFDTIAHSTMGDLVVGDYDYAGDLNQGQGFIYNRSTLAWLDIPFGAYTNTAYGIWQNGGANSTHYTIVGGLSDIINGGDAYIVNFDSATQTFSDLDRLNFDNNATLVTHFEGISAVPGGFSVTATTLQGASYAFIPVNNDGSFGTPTWTAIVNDIEPGNVTTTGNTILGTTVFGVNINDDTGVTTSYLATVPEPAYAIMCLGIFAGAAMYRRRRG